MHSGGNSLIADWFRRLFGMREVLGEQPRAPFLSTVDGAASLRDALIFLEMEIEGLEAPHRERDLGHFSGQGQDGKALIMNSLRDRMMEVSAAWGEVAGDVRAQLNERGLDTAFLEGLVNEQVPTASRGRVDMAAAVRRELEKFCAYDYDAVSLV